MLSNDVLLLLRGVSDNPLPVDGLMPVPTQKCAVRFN
jgi:hypothetical protein